MNIVLFEPSELGTPVASSDPRYRHITTVLRRDLGDSFDAGVINGCRGKARIESRDDLGLHLHFDWAPAHSPPSPTTLIIGLPRPQTARDILRDATTLGATALHFTATTRSDPNYAASSLWQNQAWHRHVVEGAAQAFDTFTPAVTSSLQLESAIRSIPPCLTPRDEHTGSFEQRVASCMALLVVSLLAVLLLNTRMAQGEYTRYDLQTRLAQSAQNQQRIATELDQAAAPARLAAAARQLGMVPSPGGAYLRLADGAVLGDPVPAGLG